MASKQKSLNNRLARSTCILDTETAFEKILDNSDRLPFFLGAGISFPEVPLAGEIVQKLARERIYVRHVLKRKWKKKFPGDQDADFESWMNYNKWLEKKDSYSIAMQEAFGDDIDDVAVTNQYFQDNILMNAIPNFSHYAIALLMKYNYINRTCITTNFDRLIEMAFMRIEGCDCIPIRTEDEINIWDHDRHYIIKVHGDGHFYNMKQTKTQTSTWDDKFRHKILGNRQHFSGLVIIGLGGHEKSIQDFFKEFRESYKSSKNNPVHHRSVLWAVRTKRPLIFDRNKSSIEHDEFINCIENEVSTNIIELFLEQSLTPIPFYFFPISNARHFFFDLTQRLIDVKSSDPREEAKAKKFRSEIKRFYGGDEWVFSSMKRAREKLNLAQPEIDIYREKLEKANDRNRTSRDKIPQPVRIIVSKNYKNSILRLLEGDIAKCESEIIVSSDDILLMMNDGVAGAIRNAAGEQIIQDVQKFENKFPLTPATVLITNAGRLNAAYIFHAAILDPKNPNQDFDKLVRDSVKQCFCMMKAIGCQSIAFPLLSSGTAGFGPRESANCICEIAKDFLDNNSSQKYEIFVCVYGMDKIKNNNIELIFENNFT